MFRPSRPSAAVRWALQTYLGVTDRDPEPLPHDEARAREFAGHYENDAMDVNIATDGAVMTLAADIKPQIRAAADEELPPGYPREEIGLLPGDGDEYIITSGMKGMRGFFTRDDSGAVVGIDAGGRMYRRVPTAAARDLLLLGCAERTAVAPGGPGSTRLRPGGW
jgi:hypothetical protein